MTRYSWSRAEPSGVVIHCCHPYHPRPPLCFRLLSSLFLPALPIATTPSPPYHLRPPLCFALLPTCHPPSPPLPSSSNHWHTHSWWSSRTVTELVKLSQTRFVNTKFFPILKRCRNELPQQPLTIFFCLDRSLWFIAIFP